MEGGAWWAAVHGVAKSRTRLSDFTFTFHFPALEKEMAAHSSVLAWRTPGTGESGGLPSMGSHRVGHDWSHLAAAAAHTEMSLLKGKIHMWRWISQISTSHHTLQSIYLPVVKWPQWRSSVGPFRWERESSLWELCLMYFPKLRVCEKRLKLLLSID